MSLHKVLYRTPVTCVITKLLKVQRPVGILSLGASHLAGEFEHRIHIVAAFRIGIPAISDLKKLARCFGVPGNAFLPESNPESRTNALLSAKAGLGDADLDEVRLYASFRKSRSMARHNR